MIGYNRLSTPADLAPSFLDQIALRKLRWIPLATAHTPVLCSARDLAPIWRRAAEVGHLAVLSAHGCMACRVHWLPTHPMNAVRRLNRALIKQNLRPTAGQLKKRPPGNKKNTFGGNRQGKGFLR
jgi:hypothetical protein